MPFVDWNVLRYLCHRNTGFYNPSYKNRPWGFLKHNCLYFLYLSGLLAASHRNPVQIGLKHKAICFLTILEVQEKAGSRWNWAGPRGAPGRESLSAPLPPHLHPTSFLFLQEASFSLHDLPWVPMGRFKLLLIRKGGDVGTRRRNSAALGQGPGFPSKDTHSNIFELFCRY